MARSNSPASLENWKAKADRAIYRASVGPNTHWEGKRPSSSLAVAGKVCPGGRMLMAFELEELRDYFVEGNADNGVQREPDGCEKAGPFRSATTRKAALPQDLASSIPAFLEARKNLGVSHNEIERVFNEPYEILLDSDKTKEAIAALNAMPDTYLRSRAISQLLDSRKWDVDQKPIWDVAAAPYTREQAGVLVRWQRARNAEKALSDVHGEFAMEKARELLDEEGEEAVKAFSDTLPPSITRSFISVMVAREARKNDGPVPSRQRPGM
jgi:hypothetical protein